MTVARLSFTTSFSIGALFGADFLSAAGRERFNLVFLDIYMGNEKGMDMVQKLHHFDADYLLVFTTSSTDYALDGFRVQTFHYLVKPCTEADLTALFDEIIKRLPTDDRYIEVNIAGSSIHLRLMP